jgi:hypothetical protein
MRQIYSNPQTHKAPNAKRLTAWNADIAWLPVPPLGSAAREQKPRNPLCLIVGRGMLLGDYKYFIQR